MENTGDVRVFHMENGMKIKVTTVLFIKMCIK